ncbi:MAG: hypothetical protein JWN48_5073, partial [Myxococcaceae bacterium]|nr:hypothetical protein [Myxococcaceae bacterium]
MRQTMFAHSRGALALLALLALLAGCGGTETRTQLNFSISASTALQSRIATLRVFIRSNNRGDQSRDFPSSGLKWPVEIVIIPTTGNHSSDEVMLTATALDASGAVLAEHKATGRFVPEKLRTIAVPLDPQSS